MTNKLSYKRLPVFLVGMIDGLIVPLTIYCFFVRVLTSQHQAVQITTIGGLVLAILLAIGAYLTRKAETNNAGEQALIKIYAKLGINEAIQKQMTDDTVQEQEKWQAEWQQGANATSNLSPLNYALTIWLGYLCGLAVIVLNVNFYASQNLGFLIVPFIVLLMAGFLKHKVASQDPLIGTLSVGLSGILAAVTNWLIAGLF